jgi:hypothetical protein
MGLFTNKKSNKPILKPTQSFLRFYEIRNDCVVMEDGTLRAVVAVSSTNFDLKSQDEQDALIVAYQRFINSLDFPIQVLMQSRRMDIGDYTESLKHLMEKQPNELLRIQTGEYIEFISHLVESANIMNKNFYIIISLPQNIFPPKAGFFARLFKSTKTREIAQRLENFEKVRTLLDERAGSVSNNLGGMSLRAVRLNTEQLIELFYNSYNFESGPLIDAGKLGEIAIVGNNNEAAS